MFNEKIVILRRFGVRQINSLAKILEFADDETLIEEKQQSIKKECMELWGVPMRARTGPVNDSPDNMCRNLLRNDVGMFLLGFYLFTLTQCTFLVCFFNIGGAISKSIAVL